MCGNHRRSPGAARLAIPFVAAPLYAHAAMLSRRRSYAGTQEGTALKDSVTPAELSSFLAARRTRAHAAHYILDGHTPMRADAPAWLRWLETADPAARVVAQTPIGAEIIVSTVFTGFDGSLEPANPAIFETEVFQAGQVAEDGRAAANGLPFRYATWDAAAAGHRAIVAALASAQERQRQP